MIKFIFFGRHPHRNFSWTFYRIYKNGALIGEILSLQNDYIVTDFNPQITTYFYVTATDEINGSEPSNCVTVYYVGNEDLIQKPMCVDAYPNRLNTSQTGYQTSKCGWIHLHSFRKRWYLEKTCKTKRTFFGRE